MNSQISGLFDMPIFVLKSLVGFIIYPLRFSSLFFYNCMWSYILKMIEFVIAGHYMFKLDPSYYVVLADNYVCLIFLNFKSKDRNHNHLFSLFCFCWFIICNCFHCLWGFVCCHGFVIKSFVSFLVLL